MKDKINLKPNKKIQPIIYCYTTPNDHAHDGYCKIGYTDKMSVEDCIYKAARRTDTECKLEWKYSAVFDVEPFQPFTDHDFHIYLEALGIERKESVYEGTRKPEYFKITPEKAKEYFFAFKRMEKINNDNKYILRKEQEEAVNQTTKYMNTSSKKEMLLNAKPRFGKTLTVYDYCKQRKAQNILIVTNRPVIATSWYNDYEKFLNTSEYLFVSNCDAVKDKEYCISRDTYVKKVKTGKYDDVKCIEFVSLQDLKGSKWFGGRYDKLKEVSDMNWDILIVDESHEGIDTFKTDVAFKQIKRKETIYLSGTPFKQIANDKFPKEAIFNWTYAQEQEMKNNWDYTIDDRNPYEDMPQLNLFTYRLSDMFKDEDNLDENNQREKYFNLNEFFKTNEKKLFVNDSDINIFLDKITTDEKYPLSNEESKSQIKHSLWLLDRVDSAKALYKKLNNHPNFKEYKIILAAGDGKTEDNEKNDLAFNKVKEAINRYDKTITLSVGQLTTGITIPEWSAVFMLCNVKSPSLYIQASFRVQNPYMIEDENKTFIRKENAYIFDFDPARTLDIMEQFANDLYSETAVGKGDSTQRALNIEKLIKYFPITGEDDNGNLVSYKPEDVIMIPIKIQSKEIVKHGFMSDFLFQNVGRIFNDEKAMKILGDVKEHKGVHSSPNIDKLSYDKYGNTKINEEQTEEKISEIVENIEKALPKDERANEIEELNNDINPKKTYMDSLNEMRKQQSKEEKEKKNKILDAFVKERSNKFKEKITQAIANKYKEGIFNSKKIENDIVETYSSRIKEEKANYEIEIEKLRQEFEDKKNELCNKEDIKKLVEEYKQIKEEKDYDFECAIEAVENDIIRNTVSDKVREIETNTQEKENKKAEQNYAFPKLKAFARSIPSFLMAYGDKNTTCDKFGEIIKPEIFKEMTGIELSDYMYFIEKHYFNEITFNNAIKEFFDTKERLADYFNEDNDEDIFDYIPPQKTNQIFTPKKVVKQMVDILEENNPDCFNRDDKTFIDIYMKSGLYITEVVKKLYRSKKMKELYPDEKERLKHIFEHQVYGLAPTEIIYKIATNFIFGSELTKDINTGHIILLDAQPYVEKGMLENKLEELFGDDLNNN